MQGRMRGWSCKYPQKAKTKCAQSRLSTELAGMWSLTVGEKASGLEEGWKQGSLEEYNYPLESHSTPCSWKCKGATSTKLPRAGGQEHHGPLLSALLDVEAASGQLFGSEPFLDLVSSIMWSHSPAPLGKEEVTGHQPNPAAAVAKSLQSCLTLCDPIDGSLPGSPVPGILQARTLEWVAISFSNA